MDLVEGLDDDLDKFLDGLATGGVVSSCPVSGDPQTIPPDGHDDQDDDFLNFLNSPHDTAAASPSTGIVQHSVLSSAAAGPDDFLEWLNDDDIQKPLYENTVRPVEEATGTDINSEGIFHPKSSLTHDGTLRSPSEQLELSEESRHQSAVAIDTASTDIFIDAVFGVPSGGSTGRDNRSYSDHLRAVIRSNFPDTQQLRHLVDDHGYVPSAYRAQIWSLLLTEEGCSEDDEVAHFDPSTAELERKQDIVSDCDAVIAAAGLSLDAAQSDALKRDMQSVLMLYCKRRQLDYRGQLCRVLSCLLAVPERPSVGLSSSCFYSIASEFLPFGSLAPAAQSIGQELTHTWLRTLLSYHSPAVVLHLDRVVPHWERPSKETSPSSAISAASSQRGSSALDALERELGLGVAEGGGGVLGDEPSISPVVSSDDFVIQSAPPSSSSATDPASYGCVPSHWITGVFSGSLPPREAALILDWAILNNDKYAGFYLSVSLLTIYSDALLRLSGSRIRRWFEDIDLSKDEWFKSIPLGPQSFVSGSWTDFIRGWLSATAALIRSTPSAFKQSLLQTEEWACLTADRQQLDISSKHSISTHTGSMHSGGGALESNNSSEHLPVRKQEFIYGCEEGDDEEQSFVRHSKELAAGGRNNLMEKFRKLSSSFPGNGSSAHPPLKTSILHPSEATGFAQDKKDKCDAVCVWASPEEVGIVCVTYTLSV
jgi:hypothetical protein